MMVQAKAIKWEVTREGGEIRTRVTIQQIKMRFHKAAVTVIQIILTIIPKTQIVRMGTIQ